MRDVNGGSEWLDSSRTNVLRCLVPSPRDQRPYNVAYYAKNREAEIDRVTRRQRATLAWLRELRTVPCADCGENFPPHVMDFDHREPSTKSFNLGGSTAMLKSRAALLEEIAKCDIVCANCHRARTYTAFMAGTIRPPSFMPRAVGGTDEQRRCREKWSRKWSEHSGLLRAFRLGPCFDCGRSFDWFAMEFDHRAGTDKVAGVTRLAGQVSLKRLLEEIEKCDIVCANCHRMRTFARRQIDTSGCGVVAARDPSKVDTRVRFPPPAPDHQMRLIEESRVLYA